MASCAIFSDFPEMLKSRNRELKTTHNTFRDCRVRFIPTAFLEIAVDKNARSKVQMETGDEFLSFGNLSKFALDKE